MLSWNWELETFHVLAAQSRFGVAVAEAILAGKSMNWFVCRCFRASDREPSPVPLPCSQPAPEAIDHTNSEFIFRFSSSKGYCIKGFSYDLHKSQNEKFVRNRKKSNWDLDPDFCSKTILTIFLEMTIRCIFWKCPKPLFRDGSFFAKTP